MKLCKQCFAYVGAGRATCPFCGYEFGFQDREQPSETTAELQQRQTEPEALKRDFYERQLAVARSKGFKPRFPAALFKERYGHWPPWAWSEQARAQFAMDGAWQATLERRLARKAKREAEEQREEAGWASQEEKSLEQTLGAMDASEPEEESFSDWLHDQGI
jgi:uncharacterized Zn finger protein (UPF0148 family)